LSFQSFVHFTVLLKYPAKIMVFIQNHKESHDILTNIIQYVPLIHDMSSSKSS
jgi:hypothetical protein